MPATTEIRLNGGTYLGPYMLFFVDPVGHTIHVHSQELTGTMLEYFLLALLQQCQGMVEKATGLQVTPRDKSPEAS